MIHADVPSSRGALRLMFRNTLGEEGMRGIFAAMALALIASTMALADPPAPVTAKDWRTFMDESMSRYRDNGDEPTFEDRLFAAGSNTTMDAAMARFARELNVSDETARAYARVLVESVKHQEACGYGHGECRFAPGAALYDLAADIGMREPSGGLLASVGMNLAGATDGVANNTRFIRLVFEHPAAASIVARVYRHNEDAPYLVALLALPLTEETASFAAAANGPSGGPDYWSGWYEAFLEAAERDAANAPPLVRASLAQRLLLHKFALGLSDDAVASYDAYPPEVRALLPVVACVPCAGRLGAMSRAAAQGLADALAAALWARGRRDDALALLNRGESAFGPREEGHAARYRALREAIEPRLSGDEVFTRFVIGGELRQDGRRREREQGYAFAFGGGPDSPVTVLVAARLRDAGYPDVAAFVERRAYTPPDDGDDTLRHMAWLSAYAAQRQPHWAERIAASRRRAEQRAPAGDLHVIVAPMERWWIEEAMPATVAPWGESDRAPAPPARLDLPVPADAIVRYEGARGEHAIVYQSTQYDLPGEVPSYGLWFAHTVGGAWQAPVYLGLQTHFPYVPTAGSRVPMFDGATLRLEVQVREIDPQSITFPPVGLSLRRSEDGVLLEFSLARLRQDLDGDGFTDIEERRLGLAVENPDSDGDGLRDGVDPLPLTRFAAAAAPERRLLAGAILNQIMGHEAGAIMIAPISETQAPLDIMRVLGAGGRRPRVQAPMPTVFLGADPQLFAGLQSRVRLILYSERDLEALARDAAPFYPPRITNVFSSRDGRTHYVIWTASWVGGEFIVRCPAGAARCETEVVSSWIT